MGYAPRAGYAPLDFQTQILLDVLGQGVVNFCMPWYRLLLPCRGIEVDVMPSPVPIQETPLARQLPNEFTAFHSVMALV